MAALKQYLGFPVQLRVYKYTTRSCPKLWKTLALRNFTELYLKKLCSFFLFLLWYPGSTLAPPRPPLFYNKVKLSIVYNWSLWKNQAFLPPNFDVIFLIFYSSWGLVADPVHCALEDRMCSQHDHWTHLC